MLMVGGQDPGRVVSKPTLGGGGRLLISYYEGERAMLS